MAHELDALWGPELGVQPYKLIADGRECCTESICDDVLICCLACTAAQWQYEIPVQILRSISSLSVYAVPIGALQFASRVFTSGFSRDGIMDNWTS